MPMPDIQSAAPDLPRPKDTTMPVGFDPVSEILPESARPGSLAPTMAQHCENADSQLQDLCFNAQRNFILIPQLPCKHRLHYSSPQIPQNTLITVVLRKLNFLSFTL